MYLMLETLLQGKLVLRKIVLTLAQKLLELLLSFFEQLSALGPVILLLKYFQSLEDHLQGLIICLLFLTLQGKLVVYGDVLSFSSQERLITASAHILIQRCVGESRLRNGTRYLKSLNEST